MLDSGRSAGRTARRATALVLAVFGAAGIGLAAALPPGGAGRIGPGVFPAIAAGLLLAAAVSLALRPDADDTASAPAGDVRAALKVLAGVALFAALLPWTGSVAAAWVTGALAASAAGCGAPRAVAIGAAGSAGVHALVVLGLGHRLPLWP